MAADSGKDDKSNKEGQAAGKASVLLFGFFISILFACPRDAALCSSAVSGAFLAVQMQGWDDRNGDTQLPGRTSASHIRRS